MRSRRALLYMPGDDLRKIQKATTLKIDTICMDMEDGVAANRKQEARRCIAKALVDLSFGQSERLARINPIGSGLEEADLETVVPAHPDGIVIPKVTHADQVRQVSQKIGGIEKEQGWSLGGICLLVVVETALGIINLREIASSDPRLEGMIFGSEDLASDLGAIRTTPAWEVFYGRSALVTHAAAFGLQAIDMVFIDFKNMTGLREEAIQGAQLGFSGKQIIHPNQVDVVQEAFTPSDESIEEAQRIVLAFNLHQDKGTGAFALDGRMIDLPIVKAAERVLMRARAAGKLIDR